MKIENVRPGNREREHVHILGKPGNTQPRLRICYNVTIGALVGIELINTLFLRITDKEGTKYRDAHAYYILPERVSEHVTLELSHFFSKPQTLNQSSSRYSSSVKPRI